MKTVVGAACNARATSRKWPKPGCGLKPLVPVLIVVSAFLPALSLADTMDDEIDYLIGSVGKSGCVFIRNGKRYTGRDARAHLRSKRRLNARLIDSTEEFIEKIASKSVTTGKPYLISCKGREEQTAGEWFTELLLQHRQATHTPGDQFSAFSPRIRSISSMMAFILATTAR